MRRRFHQVDVFGADHLTGNPLAVVVDSEGLTTDQMQEFTRWMNLSETSFLLPASTPKADYRVRIFTLARELSFAGHPTLGSAYVWLQMGGRPRDHGLLVQECGAGLVRITSGEEHLRFAAPPLLRQGPVEQSYVERIAKVLGIQLDAIVDTSWVDNGPGWVAILLSDAGAVLGLQPESGPFLAEESLEIGVVGPYPEESAYAFEVRGFFTDERGMLKEDPVTGSLNASLGEWLLSSGRAVAPYVARQGTRLGRRGRVTVDRDSDGTVWVGGTTMPVIHGAVRL